MNAEPLAAVFVVLCVRKSVSCEQCLCAVGEYKTSDASTPPNRMTSAEAIQMLLWMIRTCALNISQKCSKMWFRNHCNGETFCGAASIFAQTELMIFIEGAGAEAMANCAASLRASQEEYSCWQVSHCKR